MLEVIRKVYQASTVSFYDAKVMNRGRPVFGFTPLNSLIQQRSFKMKKISLVWSSSGR